MSSLRQPDVHELFVDLLYGRITNLEVNDLFGLSTPIWSIPGIACSRLTITVVDSGSFHNWLVRCKPHLVEAYEAATAVYSLDLDESVEESRRRNR